MRRSEITLTIELDDQNVPEKLLWNATDKPDNTSEVTKAFALSVWDAETNAIMKIDLWTKDMLVGEMKRFYIQTFGSMADTLLTATGDEKMHEEINSMCERLFKMLVEEEKTQR